ncbi:sulfurtransferase TusA family protein [Helicovermis profundi]|uniref:Sulfurtransferase TusA family protein n=1 Tax=Helicovermis profundi TaxID=3065157 RepID=A0AAU9E3L9_9FIRM|nr:sulfurtransferase TusA family protein [Clostridia bacterium S502]
MLKIDCFGDICPIPILKIQKQLKLTNYGDKFMIITDHSCVMESIFDTFNGSNLKIDSNEVMNGVWEITIKRIK